jgi:hypothetical protein
MNIMKLVMPIVPYKLVISKPFVMTIKKIAKQQSASEWLHRLWLA